MSVDCEDNPMSAPLFGKNLHRWKALSPFHFLKGIFWGSGLFLACSIGRAEKVIPASQHFRQEIAHRFTQKDGLPAGPAQLVECSQGGRVLVFLGGRWYAFGKGRWEVQADLSPANEKEFTLQNAAKGPKHVSVPWQEVRQLLTRGELHFVVTESRIVRVEDQKETFLPWPEGRKVNQIALDPRGTLCVASTAGLFCWEGENWKRVEILDEEGRDWAAKGVLGVGFDGRGQLWFATKAGVGCQADGRWRFYEGKDGLPWNDFTGLAVGQGEVWFTTHWGVIRFDESEWHYRQGLLWLPSDDVKSLALDEDGTAWIATAAGISSLERRPMTLAQKADVYENEIEHYIKRTPFGFVAEAWLQRPGDKASADPQDSDNDGLWTAMYGAGECFAFGATQDARAKQRAKHAFEALRFLQKVTQGCDHAPPKGYIARTIRPVDWPDPNIGRLAADIEEQKHDKFWKIYEPRWPKSGDGHWFWKSDTSSDELDGHYFFYPLYYDLCADSEEERERVREVVRDITDHLIDHHFCLVDHDGKPTRWGIYGPQFLNENPYWWQERGLKSLSILCYLSVAAHVTGDKKYDAAARDLIERSSYAHNAMFAKVQHGPGSGNQSDDEMAFMCYYALLRCSRNEDLKALIRYSFFQYWVNEAPEMNPFFNFAYAAHNLEASAGTPWGPAALKPWAGWHEDAMVALYGFPLDRLNWPHRNSHRLDVIDLPAVRSNDLDSPDKPRQRGYRVNGKVLPVENRHFNHWNTDPWQLDYGGNGNELAAGTVFLLPYYMGLYHGFIEKPAR
jgi:hypothetical protein